MTNRLYRSVPVLIAFGLVLVGCGDKQTLIVKSAVKTARTFDGLQLGRQWDLSRPAGGNPTSVKAKAYAAYVATGANCAAPFIQVADYGAAGSEIDPVAGGTLFTGAPAPGTYSCFMMELSDVLKFTPDAAAQAAQGAHCTTGVEKTFDILRAGDTGWKTKEGNAITAAGTVPAPAESSAEVRATRPGVTIFFSTTTSGTGLAAAADDDQVVPLTTPFTVPAEGSTTLTVTFDFLNKVSTNNDAGTDYCWMEPGDTTITAN